MRFKYGHHTYKASRYVVQGKTDEHAYNLFLDTMQVFYRLGLWQTVLKENRLHNAWHRMIQPIRLAEIRAQHYGAKRGF